jgi:hypothetical protein
VFDRKTAATLFGVTLVVVWGLITHGTHAGSGDELHYLMIARSIAFDGDVRLENDYADPANLVGGGTATAGPHVRPGRNGVMRPVHDIGLPLLAAPVVRVIYPLAQWIDATVPRAWLNRAKLNASLLLRHQLSLLMTMIAGLVAIEIWRLLRRAGVAERPAFWWTLLVTLSPPILSFAFLFFTELVAALIVLVCLRRIVLEGGTSVPQTARLKSRPPEGSHVQWLVTGLLIGLLTFIHIRNGPVSLALAVLAFVIHRHRIRVLVPFVAGIAIVAAVRTAIHWHFWGTLVFDEHARMGTIGTLSEMLQQTAVRASGLFLDQEFGLIALAPIYLLAIPGLIRLWRRAPDLARPMAVVCGACVVSLVLPMINPYTDWTGAWSPAPRFLVPIAPLLAVAAAVAGSAAQGMRALFVRVLIALQLLIAVVIWNSPKLLWDLPDGVSAFVRALPALDDVYTYLPRWHGPAASPWPFVIAGIVWAALSVWLSRPHDGGRRHAALTRGPEL